MILQELLRNWILYREVLKPVIESWKESRVIDYPREIFFTSTSFLALASNRTKIVDGGEELGWDISDEDEALSVSQISGTRTITKHRILPMNESDPFTEAKQHLSPALSSREICIVLAHDKVIEDAVNTGKTYYQSFSPSIDFIFLGTVKTISLTTGFESKQINSILIYETHEKREYLGEFSLTHEETPLMYQLGGGEHHDTY